MKTEPLIPDRTIAMSGQPAKPPVKPVQEGFPDYAGFGQPEDILARMRLLNWICEQVGNGSVEAKEGEYVLATDGRILGVGEDAEELHARVISAEPELENARLVAYFIPRLDY